MRFYGLKIFNLVQLDYYGEGVFLVTLFKDNIIEYNYLIGNPNYLNISKEWEDLNKDNYVLHTGTLQSEKCITFISFNAYSNKDDYASMLESDMEMDRGKMVN